MKEPPHFHLCPTCSRRIQCDVEAKEECLRDESFECLECCKRAFYQKLAAESLGKTTETLKEQVSLFQ